MLINSENNNDTKYSLFGFIIHKGNNLHKGHYVSIVKREKKWYLCNDSKITEINPSFSNEYIEVNENRSFDNLLYINIIDIARLTN